MSEPISNDMIEQTFQKAAHIANQAYALDQLFANVNIVYDGAIKEADKDVVEKLKPLDRGRYNYSSCPHNMGRVGENTGDEHYNFYGDINEEQKQMAIEILPVATALIQEVRKTDTAIIKQLTLEYAGIMGFVGCAGESYYRKMLVGSEEYQPYYSFGHGIFAEQVKRLCRTLAKERGIKLDESECLDLSKNMKEKIERRKKLSEIEGCSSCPVCKEKEACTIPKYSDDM